MYSTLDLLWLRVPPIRYVCPPACPFDASGSGSSGPIMVVEHPPRFKVTGLRVDNCVLRWDPLPGACSGACSVALCYNIYRQDTELGYEVIAECVHGTEFSVAGQSACFRVSALTTEGESDLSDAVCVECAEPTPPIPPMPDIPVLILTIDSEPSNIKLQWGQILPEINEIWQSIDGAEFSLLASIPGGSFYNDTSGAMPSGEIRCFKVRGVNGGINGDFSNIACAVRDKIFLGAGAVSYPTWQLAFGDLASDDITLVTTLDFSGLRAVIGGSLFLDASFVLSSVDLSNLILVSGSIHFSASSLTSLSLPLLVTIGGDLLADNTALISVSIPALTLFNGSIYAFDGSALNAASVAGILARGIASGVTSATIRLDGGTNAGLSSLSAQGQLDYAALVTAGNTMTSNP